MSSNSIAALTTNLRMFDGSGYRVWARQLQLYLEAKDAWGAVLKTTLTSLQLRMKSPTKLTKLATTIILSALTDAQSALITDMTHTQEILQTLQKTHRHTRLMLAELECYKMSLSGAEKKSNFLQSLDPDWDDYIAPRRSVRGKTVARLARTTKVPMEWTAFGPSATQRKWDVIKNKAAAEVAKFISDRRPVGPTQQDGDTV
ncbi:hypothetical protein PF003_g10775 [Phytophthora fragariae]|nr:hypothetical protein PF003_g10775 [Phytophthora fragariae]